MRVLFFIGEFSEGGAERVISVLSNNLVKEGYDIEILTYYKNKIFYELDNKIKVNCVEENTNTKSKIRNYTWVRKYFKNNADIIISFLAPFNMYALMANRGKPIIVADRNDPRCMPKKAILRVLRNKLYKKANKIIVQTEHNYNYFSDDIQRKTSIIYNPVNDKLVVGKALFTNKKNKIVSVGRLTEQKNQLMLIDAFADFVKENDSYELHIYGEGEFRNVLTSRIAQLKLEDKVFLDGQSSNIYEDINDAKLFILSSNYEGMPNALLEAMCLGLPCISTKVSGATELIEDGKNGYLIEAGNKEQLADKMKEVIENKELGNITTNAIDVYKKLSINTITRKWEDVINEVVKNV